jgi:hypothetical protein
MYSTTKVVSTTSNDALFYSRDNGVSWISLTRGEGGALTLPIDASLTSILFRIHAWFDPLLGSNSEDVYVSQPYTVKQPGGPTDVKATANSNGSVTLTWLDNSNMESRYDITRSGPDGKKTFALTGKTDSIGQVSYVDTQTSKTNDTWYVYQIKSIIDQYAIPEYLIPSEAVTIVESTPPLGQIKDIQTDAYRLGIVNGLTNDTFGPKNPITRQEMSVMLLRTVRLSKPGVALDTTMKTTFTDSSSISSWAQDAMNFVVNYGIMNGVAGNKLDPHGNTTREQAILLSLRTYLATAVLH